jgi:hypothetical protein
VRAGETIFALARMDGVVIMDDASTITALPMMPAVSSASKSAAAFGSEAQTRWEYVELINSAHGFFKDPK